MLKERGMLTMGKNVRSGKKVAFAFHGHAQAGRGQERVCVRVCACVCIRRVCVWMGAGSR
jgi:hypothetical protein